MGRHAGQEELAIADGRLELDRDSGLGSRRIAEAGLDRLTVGVHVLRLIDGGQIDLPGIFLAAGPDRGHGQRQLAGFGVELEDLALLDNVLSLDRFGAATRQGKASEDSRPGPPGRLPFWRVDLNDLDFASLDGEDLPRPQIRSRAAVGLRRLYSPGPSGTSPLASL